MKEVKLKWEAPPQALEKWNPAIISAKEDSSATLNMLSTIGEYGDGSGMTARIVQSVLRKADGGDIVVNINSPGGDFFEGVAIHSLLKDYEGSVQVNVLGLAASAASVVAMAGDDIRISKSGFMMIHNAWTIALGNKEDMREVASMLEKFDKSMTALYADGTGIEESKIKSMMAKETWLSGEEAVDMSFASGLMDEEELAMDEEENSEYNASLRRMDVALAKAGMPRSERRALIKELTGTPSAANPTPSAGQKDGEVLDALLNVLTKYKEN